MMPDPPQGEVIEKILRHCGLWHPSVPRAPPVVDDWGPSTASLWSASDDFSDSPAESFDQRNAWDGWAYVDIDVFEATF